MRHIMLFEAFQAKPPEIYTQILGKIQSLQAGLPESDPQKFKGSLGAENCKGTGGQFIIANEDGWRIYVNSFEDGGMRYKIEHNLCCSDKRTMEASDVVADPAKLKDYYNTVIVEYLLPKRSMLKLNAPGMLADLKI